jgi:hypothetical protein
MDYSGTGTKGQLNPNDKAALMSNIKQQVSVQQGLKKIQGRLEKFRINNCLYFSTRAASRN